MSFCLPTAARLLATPPFGPLASAGLGLAESMGAFDDNMWRPLSNQIDSLFKTPTRNDSNQGVMDIIPTYSL